MSRALLPALVSLLGAWPLPSAAAAPPTTHAAATASPEAPEPDPHLRLSPRKQLPWIRRWAPELNATELSAYGGMLVTSRRVELFEADLALPDQGYQPLRRVAPALGLRASALPLRWGGAELEAAVMPTHTEAGQPALLWTARGAVVGQLPLWSVTPFVLVGGGIMAVSSKRSAVGNDVDAAMIAGGGVKVHVGRFVHLRLDVRDVITARRGYQAGLSNNPEILLGVGITLGRRRDVVPVEPRDRTEAEPHASHDDDALHGP